MTSPMIHSLRKSCVKNPGDQLPREVVLSNGLDISNEPGLGRDSIKSTRFKCATPIFVRLGLKVRGTIVNPELVKVHAVQIDGTFL